MSTLHVNILSPIDSPGVIVCKLTGVIDSNTVGEFKGKLELVLDSNSFQDIILDFNSLSYINSEGIGLLMDIIKRVKKAKKNISLVELRDQVKEVVELIGIGQVAKTYNHLADAIASLS